MKIVFAGRHVKIFREDFGFCLRRELGRKLSGKFINSHFYYARRTRELLRWGLGEGFAHELIPNRRGHIQAVCPGAHRFVVIVADPDADRKAWRVAHGPGIAKLLGGSGFYGHGAPIRQSQFVFAVAEYKHTRFIVGKHIGDLVRDLRINGLMAAIAIKYFDYPPVAVSDFQNRRSFKKHAAGAKRAKRGRVLQELYLGAAQNQSRSVFAGQGCQAHLLASVHRVINPCQHQSFYSRDIERTL